MKIFESNIGLATFLAVLTALWMASGLFADEKQNQQQATDDSNEKLFKVEVVELKAQNYPFQIVFNARTEANRVLELKSQTQGRVSAVNDKEGLTIDRNETVCTLEDQDKYYALEEAKAYLNKAEIDYQGALKLKRDGYQSKSAIADAKAQLEQAKTRLKRARLDVEYLEIKAPFDSILQERTMEVGDFAQAGAICARLIDLNPLLISANVSADKMAMLKANAPAQVKLIDGREFPAQLKYISRQSSPKTRSYKIELELENPSNQIAAGLTARVKLEGKSVKAHLISSSLFSLDDEGKLGIKIVDDRGVVDFVHVELIADDPDGVWITGLNDTVKLIVVGNEYVAEGQNVDIVWRQDKNKSSGES